MGNTQKVVVKTTTAITIL